MISGYWCYIRVMVRVTVTEVTGVWVRAGDWGTQSAESGPPDLLSYAAQSYTPNIYTPPLYLYAFAILSPYFFKPSLFSPFRVTYDIKHLFVA